MASITDRSNVVVQKHGLRWWAVSQEQYGLSPHYDIRLIVPAVEGLVELPEHTERAIAVLQLAAPNMSSATFEYGVPGIGWINAYTNTPADTYWVTAEYDPRKKI